MMLRDTVVLVDERPVPHYMIDAGRLYCAANARIMACEQEICVENVDGLRAVRCEAQRIVALAIVEDMLALFSMWMGVEVTHVEMKNG